MLKRILQIFPSFILIASLGGCASVGNTFCGKKIYGGVKADAYFIASDIDSNIDATFFVLGLIDIPLSLVADTILLPVNAIQNEENCLIGPS